jgi:hypothetical protein
MHPQEPPPGRRRRPRGSAGPLRHVLGDRVLADVVAELGELPGDAPTAPRRVVPGHALDQLDDLCRERRTAARPRLTPKTRRIRDGATRPRLPASRSRAHRPIATKRERVTRQVGRVGRAVPAPRYASGTACPPSRSRRAPESACCWAWPSSASEARDISPGAARRVFSRDPAPW